MNESICHRRGKKTDEKMREKIITIIFKPDLSGFLRKTNLNHVILNVSTI